MLKQYFKRIGAKRMVIMLLGNVFLGMGVSIFKLSEMGTDPFSGMVMALAEVLGIGYPVFLILVNLVLLFVEVKFGCIGRLKIYEDFISGMQCKIYSFQSCCL